MSFFLKEMDYIINPQIILEYYAKIKSYLNDQVDLMVLKKITPKNGLFKINKRVNEMVDELKPEERF